MSSPRRPVALHPWAWWAWALLVAAGVSLTTNPLVLLLCGAALSVVVLLRRTDAPWARSVRAYFVLAGIVIGIRLVFQIVLGAPTGSTVLFALPEVGLPDWAQGIRLGGPVTAEALLATLYDALRLAVMLLCLGAANALANPRRALRSVPAALYEASVAVVIALSVAPQLIESGQRVRRARRLRGGSVRGLGSIRSLLVPVLEDAIERALALAAGMEARGFARTVDLRHRGRLLVGMLGSAMLLTLGAFLFLDGSHPGIGVGLGIVGAAGTLAGLRLTGRRLRVTRYRPEPWGWRESGVVAAAAAATGTLWLLGTLSPEALRPATEPLAWPSLPALGLLAPVLTALPLLGTLPPRPAPTRQPRLAGATDRLRPRPRTRERVPA